MLYLPFVNRVILSSCLLVGVTGLGMGGCGSSGSSEQGTGGQGEGGQGAGAGSGTAGSTGAAGRSGAAGTTGSTGLAGTTGGPGIAGTTGAAGHTATTGVAGTNGTGAAGTTGTAGINGRAGTSGAAGTSGVAGTSGAAGTTGAAGSTGSCGSSTHNLNPFGCKFAWGTNTPSGSLSSYSYLQFMSNWIGTEIQANGSISSCSGCTWLTSKVAPTSLIPVYYAYIIGYLGHANGFPDGNNTSGASLTTGGAYIVRKYRSQIVAAYAYYAQQTHAAWPTKPLVWLLEGDFIQYSVEDSSQVNYPNATPTNPGSAGAADALSYAELGQLAADITCAIKSNMPNAVVAIDHTTWSANADITNYWNAMANVNYDMVWTSGVANDNGYFTAGTTSSSYNATTANYAYVHNLTKRTMLVDTSFGTSAMSDTWAEASAATINSLIADGVIAANVTTVPSNYSADIASLEPSLTATCE
jgi:hypothetical protein